MALDLNQITAITQKKFIPKLVDNIFDSSPVLQRAKKKGWYKKLDGGTEIVQPLAYAQNSASAWYTGAETLSTTDNEQFTGAVYQWKQLHVSISISGIDELKNSGDSQIVDFVKSKTQHAEKTMADLLGDGIYSAGTNTKSIVGLRVIVDSGNTVGAIDQSTYSWWQSQEDSSTTTLTLSALQTMHTSLTINDKGPSVITATRANYNRYYALLQLQQRFTDGDTAKGGFTNLLFNGVPFIADSKCPANHIFMLNEDNLYLWVHSARDFKMEPFQKPINQDVKSARLLWAGALGTDACRMHGKLSAVAA